MGDEVNKLDLFSLLTIKVSTPGLFDFILKHADYFLGKERSDDVNIAIRDELRRYSSNISFLKKLFPTMGNSIIDVKSDWHLEKRLGSPEHFWTYFMYSVPSGKLSESDFEFFNDTLDREQQYVNIAEVYNKMSDKSSSYELNKNLKNRMASYPVERKLRLLAFIITHFHEEYKKNFQNQLHRSLIIELLVDLSNSPEVNAAYTILLGDMKNWSLVGEVYSHKFGKTFLDGRLQDFFAEEINYDTLMEHTKEDIDQMFTVWFETVPQERRRNVLTSWAKEHGFSSTVRLLIKDSHLQEDYDLLFVYVNILKSIPLKLIKEALKQTKQIDSSKAAVAELRNTDQPQLVILSYMDNCIYDYVLGQLNDNKGKLKDDFTTAVLSLCTLGNSERINEIRNKLMEISTNNTENLQDT